MATVATNGVAAAGLSKDQQHELDELEKIIKLRDTVYAGKHRSVKIPGHLVSNDNLSTTSAISAPFGQVASTAEQSATTNLAPTNKTVQALSSSAKGESIGDKQGRMLASYFSVPRGDKKGTAQTAQGQQSATSKSDVVKARVEARRQQLEGEIQKAAEDQTNLNPIRLDKVFEPTCDYIDVGEVLSKAMALIKEGPTNSPHGSFGNSTFYSSDFEIPERRTSSSSRLEPGEINSRPASPQDEGRKVAHSSFSGGLPISEVLPPSYSSAAFPSRAQQTMHELSRRQAIGQGVATQDPEQQVTSSRQAPNAIKGKRSPVAQSFAGNSTVDADERGDRQPPNSKRQMRSVTVEEADNIITNNLSPVAPQPVRLSPLATAKGPLLGQQDSLLQSSLITPLPADGQQSSSAEVIPGLSARKRKELGQVSHGSGGANASGRISADSIVIKREPLSASPAFETLPRPNKRPRQSFQLASGLDYDEPSLEEPRQHPQQPSGMSRRNKGKGRGRPEFRNGNSRHRARDADQIGDAQYATVSRNGPPPQIGAGRDMDDAPSSAAAPTASYAVNERPMRTAPRSSVEYSVSDPAQDYRGAQVVSAATRPEYEDDLAFLPAARTRRPSVMVAPHSTIMAPPPRMRERIFINEYGREMVERVQVVPRQSVIPQSRIAEPIYVDDMPPPRRIIRAAPQAFYDDDCYIVDSQERSYVQPRRVISHSDLQFESPAYQSYDQREYSNVPIQRGQMGGTFRDNATIDGRRRVYSGRPIPSSVEDFDEDGYAPRLMQPPPRQVVYVEQPPRIIRMGSIRPDAMRPAYSRAPTRAPSVHVEGSRRVGGVVEAEPEVDTNTAAQYQSALVVRSPSVQSIGSQDGEQRQGPPRQEPSRQAPARGEPVYQELVQRETMRQEYGCQEPRLLQEYDRQQSMRQEYAQQEYQQRRRPIGYEQIVRTADGREEIRFVPAEQLYQDEVPYVPRRQVQQTQQVRPVQREMYEDEVPYVPRRQVQQTQQVQREMYEYDDEAPQRVYR